MISRFVARLAKAKGGASAPDGSGEGRKPRATTPGLKVLLLLAVALLAAFNLTPFGALLRHIEHLRAYLDGFGIWAEAIFAALTAAMIMIGSPRLLFYGVGGLLFGFWQGLVAALVGSLLGSIVMFRLARWGGRRWVRERFGEQGVFSRIARIRPSVMAVIMVRQLPISNIFINVGLALSRVRSQAFVLGTLIGFLPQGVIACLIGSGLADGDALQGVAQIVMAIVLAIVIGVWAYLRQAARRGGPDA